MKLPLRIPILLLLLTLVATQARAEETLTISYIGDRLSFGSLSVLQVAYSRLGITLKTKQLPAARALTDADKGDTDGDVHRIWEITGTHPNLVRVDHPVNTLEGIALAKTFLPIETAADLYKYRIGIKRGLVYAEELARNSQNVSKLSHSDKLLNALLLDRVDIVITDRTWANLQIAAHPNSGLRILDPPLLSIPLYHYVHKRNRDLAPKLKVILEKMEKSGEAQELRQTAYKEYKLKGNI